MRIAVVSLQQETNTFTPLAIGYEDFDLAKGDAMLNQVASTPFLREAGVEIVPTLHANAVPSGRLDEGGYRRFLCEILERIPREGLDGVLMHLHGSMEVEGIGSGEAYLAEKIRGQVGSRPLIAVSLDFHANNDERLISAVDIVCGYRTAPHTDIAETQMRAARLLVRCLRERLAPRPVMVRVPLILSGDMVTTTIDPGKSLIGKVLQAESRPGILCASLFNGQPWVDAPNTGASIVLVAESDPHIAAAEAKQLALMFWEARRNFHYDEEALDPEEAVGAALQMKEGLTFITDSGDNPGAGAAGDNTLLLRLLLARGAERTVVAGIVDHKAVALCRRLKAGDRVRFKLGGGIDPHSEALEIDGTYLHSGEIPGWSGGDAAAAKCASVPAVVVRTGGIDIVITENRCSFLAPEHFRGAGIDLGRYRIATVKCGYLSPEFKKIAGRAILALTPGASCQAIERLYFCRLRRPIYPLDPECEFQPE